MSVKARVYWRTQAGESALASGDPSVPADYRRILRLIDGRTHAAVVRGCLRQFPDVLLNDWLDELEQIGYLASQHAEITQDLELRALLKKQRELRDSPRPEDKPRIDAQSAAANTALEQHGVFLAQDRLANREPMNKKPSELAVLIVEDDPDQAALADLRVRTAGYRTRLAESCKQLVDLMHGHDLPDLILLDVMLPDVNGFEILATLRSHEMTASLPVIMLTSLADRDNIQRGVALGADGYMTKPYSKNILTDTIRKVLKHA